MGIIGRADPVQSTAIVTRDNFTGDGSTTQFVMTKKAPHERSVFITIDGIKQHEDVYSVADKTITFTSAPANNAKIETILIEDVVETAPADGSVTPNKTVGMQNVIQVVNTSTVTSTTSALTIPDDDTIPQITEGYEVLTSSITPTNASNILMIEVFVNYAHNVNATVAMALFQDATADALASTAWREVNLNLSHRMVLPHYMVAGTTSSTTFSVRMGASSGTFTINGSGGVRKHGGVMASSITITEYKA